MFRMPLMPGRAAVALFALCLLASTLPVLAQPSQEDRIRQLEQRVQELSKQLGERDRRLEQLETQVRQTSEPAELERRRVEAQRETLDEMLRDLERRQPAPSGDILAVQLGDVTARLIDVSVDILTTFGSSTASGEDLRNLQGHHHDPRERGFTFQGAELSFIGAVDPYFHGELHLLAFHDVEHGETGIEVEEAFFTTQTMPWNLQLKMGYFLTEFGHVNPLHIHQYEWLDRPVIATRLFGEEGMRAPGARLSWLTPLPWYNELFFGIQNPQGAAMYSFMASDEALEERPIGGRPFEEREIHAMRDMVYLLRWAHGFDVGDEWTFKVGGSGLYGPNATGPDGDTWIYGADLRVRWRPVGHDRGWPFVLWQSEYMRRDYRADETVVDGTPIDAMTLNDHGFYTQLLYGFTRGWAAGLRYEFATGSGDSVDDEGDLFSHREDPFRDRRHRVSPMLLWHPTEFSRIRLQYNYDRATHLEERHAHSVWLGFEILFGAHPVHSY